MPRNHHRRLTAQKAEVKVLAFVRQPGFTVER
jgi:hypothetical protein